MMLGDTDFFVDLSGTKNRFHPRAVAKVEELDHQGEPVIMSVMTRFELFSGSERFFDPPQERARIQGLLARYAALPLTAEGADRAGKIHGALAKAGEPIGAVDALIAAVALENDLPLLTRNLREFAKVQGLKLETY